MAGGGGGGLVGGILSPVTGMLFGEEKGPGNFSSGFATPKRPEFESLLDPKTGLLKSQYMQNWGADVNPDMRGMEAFREKALAKGPSSWANLAMDQQKLEEQGQRASTDKQAMSAQAQARGSLAAKRGLSAAASERLAKQSMRDQLAGQQNVGFQGAMQRGNIGLQDEQMKNQFLSALPGQENALAGIGLQNKQGRLGTDAFNIQNSIGEKRAKDADNMNAYNEQMRAWAASKQGDAMKNSGGGGKK